MIRYALDHNRLGDFDPAMLRVLEEVAARRQAGEHFPDEKVIESHPELMPQLRDMLHTLSEVEAAGRRAAHATLGHQELPFCAGPGHTLARDALRGYELREIIGRGAMGVVYQAIQSGTRRPVAIKVMVQGPFDGQADQARFEREARILAQLKHPNIVTVYDTGWNQGRFFLVMDYVDGEPLDRWLAAHDLALDEKLRLFAEIAETVHAAHLRGVIHRDLKPSNIRVDSAGCPHLLDFGLAKVVSNDSSLGGDVPEPYAHSMTMTGQFVGSLPWASPEQAEGAPGKIDIRTDLYSLGVIFYHALAGRFPYPVTGNLRDVIDRILTVQPQGLRSLDATIDEDVDVIVQTCLRKERERRYQSAGDLALDLRRRAAGEPISARRDSSWYVLRKALRRHRLAAAVTSGFLIVSVIYAAAMSVLYRNAQREADRAQRTLGFLQETLFQASAHRLGSSATLGQVLDVASRRLAVEFAHQPEVEAALRFTVGSAYETLMQKEEGIAHLRRALELNRRLHGASHPDTLRVMSVLGMVLAETANPEGVDLLRKTLELRRQTLKAPHPLLADSLGGLAYALWAASLPPRWDEAQRLYDLSIAMFDQTVGRANADLARTLTGYASMLRARGRTEEARPVYEEACETSRQLLGDNHQFTVECRIGLADLLVELAAFRDAQVILDAELPRAERLFGAEKMPGLLRRRVYLKLALSDLPGAERTLFDVEASVCELLASKNPEQSERLAALAKALREKAGTLAADGVFLESVDAVQQLELQPLESVRSLIALGQIRHRQQDFLRAEPVLRQCLAYLETIRLAGRHIPLKARAVRMLAAILRSQGRNDEAETLLRRQYDEARRFLGDNESTTRFVADDLAALYFQTGRLEQAAALQSEGRKGG